MINNILKHSVRFVFLVLLQVLILNNIQLNGFINPYLYILFIIMLPFEIPVWLLMLLAFVMGISIDMFLNTMGIHAAACVFMAYTRSYVLNFFSPRDGYESNTEPSLEYLGLTWFLSYSSIMVFIHHFVFFFIEAFRLTEFFSTFFRVIVSSVFTILLIIISQYVAFKGKDKR